jgi:hypothetical protein
MLHIILYEVPHSDFHHIDGDLMLVPWSFWINFGGFIFMEPLSPHGIISFDGDLWMEESHFSLVGW